MGGQTCPLTYCKLHEVQRRIWEVTHYPTINLVGLSSHRSPLFEHLEQATILTKRMDTQGNYLQGLYPFSETILQDFSRLQIDLSRTPKFTLTLSLTEVTNNLFLLAISTHYQTYQ